MFKYTKRILSDIRFWRKEFKIRRKENAEWERIENEAEAEWRHPMAGLMYYKQMNHNREERKRIHQEDQAAIQ